MNNSPPLVVPWLKLYSFIFFFNLSGDRSVDLHDQILKIVSNSKTKTYKNGPLN